MIVMAVCSQVGFLTVSAAEEVKSGPETYVFRKSVKDIRLGSVEATDEEWSDMEWATLSYRASDGATVTPPDGYSAKFKGLWKEVDGQPYLYYILDVYNPVGNKGGTFQFFVNGVKEDRSFDKDANSPGYYEFGKLGSYNKVNSTVTNHCVIKGKIPLAKDLTSFAFDLAVKSLTAEGKGLYYSLHGTLFASASPKDEAKGVLSGETVSKTAAPGLASGDATGYPVYRTFSNVTVDGKIGDDEAWNAVPWSTKTFKSFSKIDSSYTEQKGFSAKMKAMWQKDGSAAYLYVLIECNDATYSTVNANDQLLFAVHESGDKIDGSNKLTGKKSIALYVPEREGLLKTDYYEYKIDDRRKEQNGYTFELKYTIQNGANVNSTIHMDFYMQDKSADGDPKTGALYTWTGSNWFSTADKPTGVALLKDIPVFAVDTKPGASIRLKEESGIRFETSVDTAALNRLATARTVDGHTKAVAGATVTTGTLMVPTNSLIAAGLNRAGAFTKENLLSAGMKEGSHFFDLRNTDNQWIDGSAGSFMGTLYNIREESYLRQFSAIGYVRVTLRDGTAYTVYGGYTPENARSVAEVADRALKDTTQTWSETEKAALNRFISRGVPATVSVMQYNVLRQADNWAANAGITRPLEERAKMIRTAVLTELPDVLTLAERYEEWTDYLGGTKLEGYTFVADTVEGNVVNRTPIAYRTDKFDLQESGFRFYTGSALDGINKRGITYAVLKDRASGKEFAVFATHWTSGNGDANSALRSQQSAETAAFIAEILNGRNLPVVAAADFNANTENSSYQSLLSGAHLTDSDVAVNGMQSADRVTSDHIAFSGCTATRFEVLRPYLMQRISDHAPICCKLKF